MAGKRRTKRERVRRIYIEKKQPKRAPKITKRQPYVKSEETGSFIAAMRIRLCYTDQQIADELHISTHTLRQFYADELAATKTKIDIAIFDTVLAMSLGGTGRPGDERDWRKANAMMLKHYTTHQMGWREKTEIELAGGLTIKIGKEFEDL